MTDPKPEYPKREPFFANRHARLLTKSAAAQVIGADGCWLVTLIVQQEDVIRYKRPVTYWNGQLMPLLGAKSEETLNSTRKRAVAAGWLHYEPGAKGRPGRYWATVPKEYESLIDAPMDEGDFDSPQLSGVNDSDSPQNSGVKSRRKPGQSAGLSYLRPKPVPKESARALFDDSEGKPGKPKRKQYTDEFESFWTAYPRKAGKRQAATAFDKAVARIAADGNSVDPAAYLTERAVTFAKSEAGRSGQYCPHPTTWLNRGNYDDDQSEWDRSGSGNSGRDAGHYDPPSADDDFAILAAKVQDFTKDDRCDD